jgi:hypothetical protein
VKRQIGAYPPISAFSKRIVMRTENLDLKKKL